MKNGVKTQRMVLKTLRLELKPQKMVLKTWRVVLQTCRMVLKTENGVEGMDDSVKNSGGYRKHGCCLY